MDFSLPGSSVLEIFHTGILEWIAICFCRGSPDPGIKSLSPTWQKDSLPLSHQGSRSKHCTSKEFLESDLHWRESFLRSGTECQRGLALLSLQFFCVSLISFQVVIPCSIPLWSLGTKLHFTMQKNDRDMYIERDGLKPLQSCLFCELIGCDRGWDGWMASSVQRTWVWVSSRRQWRTGKPGMLQSTGLQRVRHDWATQPPPPISILFFLFTDWTPVLLGVDVPK